MSTFTSVVLGLKVFSLSLAPAAYGSKERSRSPSINLLATFMLALMIKSVALSTTVIQYHSIGEVYVLNYLTIKLDGSQFISDLCWIRSLSDVARRSESELEYELI